MKAVQIHQYGGAEELVYEDAPIPEIQPDDVLVKIYASGVNPIDYKVRQGYRKEQVNRTFPLIIGWDMAGVIEKTGDKVTGFKTGDEVYGRPDTTRPGTYAEYVAVRASEISFKPKSADFITAAAIPLAGLTAWQGLFDHGQLKAGQKILINGAAGGVGTYAVQFAKWKGAFVVGTASKENADFLKSIGADQVADYHEENFLDRIKDVDVVFDTIGGEAQNKLLAVLKPGGILVSTVGIKDENAISSRGVRSAAYMASSTPAQLKEIADLIDDGKIKIFVSKVLPLQEAAEAHRLIEKGHTQGKIVLQVAG